MRKPALFYFSMEDKVVDPNKIKKFISNWGGKKTTKRQIMIYSTILFAVTILPFLLGFSGFLYLISSLILNSYFCYLAFRLLRSCDDDKLLYAPKLFKFSILYLYSIFSFLVIDMVL